MRIYLEKNNQPDGPYTPNEIGEKLTKREVGTLARDWHEDITKRTTVVEVLELQKPSPLTRKDKLSEVVLAVLE